MSKNPTRKSIIANFGVLSATLSTESEQQKDTSTPQDKDVQPTPAPRVGAGVIGATQRAISDIRDERDRLKALVDAGAVGTLDLDSNTIDPSPFPDRLPDDGDDDFAAFKKVFEEEGQKVPIQVRPHPTASGRYQVIYGHRRLRAARELGVPVKGIVVEMSDRDLVVSQGIENAARQDLTWIERAMFARRMDDAGIKPRDIYAALTIDDAELARMRGVYRKVPAGMIETIGRAPKIGRPRWVDFAKRLSEDDRAKASVQKALSADRIRQLASNERFRLALEAATASIPEPPHKEDGALIDRHGVTLAEIRASRKEVRVTALSKRGIAFTEFLRREMPHILERFEESAKAD